LLEGILRNAFWFGRVLKLTLATHGVSLLHNVFQPLHRPLQPAELEDVIQRWIPGREARIWLLIEIVADECPGVELQDFRRYLALSSGQASIDRGFDILTYRSKLTHIY
jgi:hypothetical protein